jgi:hypothetical protein
MEASEAVYRFGATCAVAGYGVFRGGSSTPWSMDEDVLLRCLRKFILIQPRRMISEAIFRKARVLPVRAFAKSTPSVWVYENRAARPMTKAESQALWTDLVRKYGSTYEQTQRSAYQAAQALPPEKLHGVSVADAGSPLTPRRL